MIKSIIKGIIIFILAAIGVFLVVWASYLFYKKLGYQNKSILEIQQENFQQLGIIDITTTLDKEVHSRAQKYSQDDMRFFSTPSVYAGKVFITQIAPSVIPEKEYIIIKADAFNDKPINISGWSIQNITTGYKAVLPDAVEDLKLHGITPTYSVNLVPGQSAIINTGQSPLGVSFLENICTGYLNSSQKFYPPLKDACPPPEILLENTSVSQECLAFAGFVPACYHIDSNLNKIAQIPQNCKNELKPYLTYSYCREKFGHSKNFFKDSTWRLYLNQPFSLYSTKKGLGGVVRLLDEYGRVVDVYEY